MKINLQKIEATLKDFFENDLQLVANRNPVQNLTNEIISAMEDNLIIKGAHTFAPNIYRVSLQDKKLINEIDLNEWKKTIQEIIRDIARDNAFQLAGPLHIQIFYKPKLIQPFKIEVGNSAIPSGETVSLVNQPEKAASSDELLSAYLILADESYYSITKSITTIGRRENNDLVIDNLRVSRVHAQIRQIKDKHVLFDLDSASGTSVNGVKIHQHTLNHGDVINIADVPLIYGINQEDLEEPETDKSKTRMLSGRNEKRKEK